MKLVNIAVVGATGMVGRNFLKILDERNIPYSMATFTDEKKIEVKGARDITLITSDVQNIICNDFYFKIEKKVYPYLKLYKVFETQDYFYLYIDEEHAALVNKKGFKIGNVEAFTDFIKKKCLFKYSKQG